MGLFFALLAAAALGAAPRVEAIRHAASYAKPPLAPGQLAVVFGEGLAGAGSTKVFFDGVEGNVAAATAGQVNIVVPADAEPGSRLQVVIEVDGERSAPAPLEVVRAAPGVFTHDRSGSGPSVAQRDGAVVRLAVTGLGRADNVAAEVGGGAVEVVSYGPEPDTPGVEHVALRLPDASAFGEIPVVIRAGGRESQSFALLPLELGGRPRALSVLDNGLVRAGASMILGGAITYLSKSGAADNMINNWDYGRQVQLSFYSGPVPFGNPHPNWTFIGWNPIGAGDVYKNPSQVVAHWNDGGIVYVRTIPLHWPLNNVACECTFETWMRLEDNAVITRARLRNHRSDRTWYNARTQELPAVYVNGKYYRLFTYDGTAPFTGEPPREIRHAGPPWTTWAATENWAAYVDDNRFGLGVYHPGVYRFSGGFAGRPGTGGENDSPTGYIAPNLPEHIDRNIVYDYEFHLVPGTVEEIRDYVYRRRGDAAAALPEYIFANDRRHWTLVNTRDAGWPVEDALRLTLDRNDPYMVGPPSLWRAEDVPKLFIRMAVRSANSNAEVFWSTPTEGMRAGRSVRFQTIPDGEYRTYEVDMTWNPEYKGAIAAIRLDPVGNGAPGETASVAWISYRRLE